MNKLLLMAVFSFATAANAAGFVGCFNFGPQPPGCGSVSIDTGGFQFGQAAVAVAKPAAVPASSLSGRYVVQTNCYDPSVQPGEIEQIDATGSQFLQSLDTEGQDFMPLYPLLKADIGDVIVHPTPDLIAEGYTSTDRQITSYNAAGDQVQFDEYVYDYRLSDDQGLATGLYKTVIVQSQGDALNYTLHYGDGRQYFCSLTRIK